MKKLKDLLEKTAREAPDEKPKILAKKLLKHLMAEDEKVLTDFLAEAAEPLGKMLLKHHMTEDEKVVDDFLAEVLTDFLAEGIANRQRAMQVEHELIGVFGTSGGKQIAFFDDNGKLCVDEERWKAAGERVDKMVKDLEKSAKSNESLDKMLDETQKNR